MPSLAPSLQPKRITASHVRDVLCEVSDTDPDHIDRRAADGLSARYLDHGQPNCLVAKVLIALGFPLAMLRDMDRERAVGDLITSGVKVADSRHPALRRVDGTARALLQYVQDAQDLGHAWGDVVTAAFARRHWTRQVTDRRRRPWLY